MLPAPLAALLFLLASSRAHVSAPAEVFSAIPNQMKRFILGAGVFRWEGWRAGQQRVAGSSLPAAAWVSCVFLEWDRRLVRDSGLMADLSGGSFGLFLHDLSDRLRPRDPDPEYVLVRRKWTNLP